MFMQPHSERRPETPQKKKSRKARRRRTEQKKKFLRQNSWLILLAVLVLVALILFICVITGGREAPQPAGETVKKAPYEKAYLCAASPSVSYFDENLEPAGTAVRGSEVTYTTDTTRKKDGVTYYMTYLDSLKFGYVSEANLTDDPDDVVKETSVFVRTPQNLRLSPESEIGRAHV